MNQNDLSYDILKEMFNISVGKAASMLSEIINKRIVLDVPSVEILNPENQNIEIEESFIKVPGGALMVSSIDFGDKITGEANLIFPANKMRRFINLCMDVGDEKDEPDMDFTDMDFDIIREIGNIILNSIVGGMGNFLNTSLKYTLPKVKVYHRIDFAKNIKKKKHLCMLILYITFIIDDTEIEGAVIIDLTLNSLNELMELIKKAEDDLNG